MQIEIIPVSGSRPAVAAILQAALELREDAKVIPEVSIGMNHVTLEQIPVAILRP